MTGMPHAARPCGECPWRTDVPVGKFPPERYEALRDTAGSPGHEIQIGGKIFACHMSVEGKDRACAGYLAVCGIEHLGIRYAIATGDLPPEVLTPQEGWPELYESYDALADANEGPDPL